MENHIPSQYCIIQISPESTSGATFTLIFPVFPFSNLRCLCSISPTLSKISFGNFKFKANDLFSRVREYITLLMCAFLHLPFIVHNANLLHSNIEKHPTWSIYICICILKCQEHKKLSTFSKELVTFQIYVSEIAVVNLLISKWFISFFQTAQMHSDSQQTTCFGHVIATLRTLGVQIIHC